MDFPLCYFVLLCVLCGEFLCFLCKDFIDKVLTRTSRKRKAFNHEGHEGSRRITKENLNEFSFVLLCVLCGKFPCFLCKDFIDKVL